jgi:HEPN domain-containing protein
MSSPTPEEIGMADLFLAKAASDLAAARTLSADPGQDDDVIGFHAQQATEKALKALVAVRGLELPRSHDIAPLLRLLESREQQLPTQVKEADWLNPWAVTMRYDEPTSSTYAALREAAEEVDAWEVERPAARAALKHRDVRGFIDALLADGDIDLAWKAALAAPTEELDPKQRLRLAEGREAEHPGEALAVYQALAEEVLQTADRRAYDTGVRILKKAARAAELSGRRNNFIEHISRLRETYRRRPSLIAIFDKAGFV